MQEQDVSTPPSATEGASGEAAQAGKQPKVKGQTRELIEAVLVAIVLALFIRTFIVQAFKIPSGSMIPTLQVGDHILVNKFIYGIPNPLADEKFVEFGIPERGDVIVFRFPNDPDKDFIKRVIGVPGDRVEMAAGRLRINGQPIPVEAAGRYEYTEAEDETGTADMFLETLNGTAHPFLLSHDPLPGKRTFGPIVVPEGQLFVMGDNRDHSNDSRYWGFVPLENVRGRAMFIYFSWNGAETNVRWNRLGDWVR